MPIRVTGSLRDVEFRVASILAVSEALLPMVETIHLKTYWRSVVVVAQPQQCKSEVDFQRGKALHFRTHNMNTSNTDYRERRFGCLSHCSLIVGARKKLPEVVAGTNPLLKATNNLVAHSSDSTLPVSKLKFYLI